MFVCQNCGQELEDGTLFCNNCGAAVAQPAEAVEAVEAAEAVEAVEAAEAAEAAETVFCSNCGFQTSAEFAFCQNCGASIAEEPAEAPKKGFKLAMPKLSKKVLLIAGGALVAVIAIVVALLLIFGGGTKRDAVFYIKDGELYGTKLSKIEPWQLTRELTDGEDLENRDFYQAGYQIGMYTCLSQDGKTIFYPDKIDEDGFTLYYRSMNKPDGDATKIDSGVASYCVSKNGKCVTYLKEDGDLYQHDLKDKEKIASDVIDFYVTEDGKKLVFLTEDNNVYMKNAGKDKEKVASDISQLSYVNDKRDTVYYIKDENLYKQAEGKDKEKIASDVTGVDVIYESGEVYYYQMESQELSLADYVDDDMKEADASFVMPDYPEYPYSWNYDTYDEYLDAWDEYEKLKAAYDEAWDKRYEVQDRDSIREALADLKVNYTSYTLYYFDGKEAKEVAKDVAGSEYSMDCNTDYFSPVAVFQHYVRSEVDKVKISEIESVYDLQTQVQNALTGAKELNIAVKSTVSELESEDENLSEYSFDVSEDGKTVYYLDNVDEEDGHGTLYKMKISGDKPQKAEEVDDDVYSGHFAGDKYLYYKDVKDSQGELYIDQKKVDDDVYMYSVTTSGEIITYLTDYDTEDHVGTLKIYKNGKSEEIAEEVLRNYVIDGKVVYLAEYNIEKYRGELYQYKNGKSEKIDEDVVTIIIPYSLTYGGR